MNVELFNKYKDDKNFDIVDFYKKHANTYYLLINQTFAKDREKVVRIEGMLSTTILPYRTEKKYHIWESKPSGGKTALLEFHEKCILGEWNVTRLEIDKIQNDKYTNKEMEGKLMINIAEPSGVLRVSKLDAIVGREKITIRGMNKEG